MRGSTVFFAFLLVISIVTVSLANEDDSHVSKKIVKRHAGGVCKCTCGRGSSDLTMDMDEEKRFWVGRVFRAFAKGIGKVFSKGAKGVKRSGRKLRRVKWENGKKVLEFVGDVIDLKVSNDADYENSEY